MPPISRPSPEPADGRLPLFEKLHGVTVELAGGLEAAGRVARAAGWSFVPHGGTYAGVVCLHQGLGEERFTLIAADPIATVSGSYDRQVLTAGVAGDGPQATFTDPFDAVRSLIAPYRCAADPRAPFLGGGAVGSWGYGCRFAVEPGLRRREAAPPCAEVDMRWAYYDTGLVLDHSDGSAWLFSQGIDAYGAQPTLEAAHAKLARWREAIGRRGAPLPTNDAEPPRDDPPLAPAISRGAYGAQFDGVREAIGRGDIYQGCLTFPMTAPRAHHDAKALFLELAAEHPAPHASLLVFDAPTAIASASPERFLAIEGRRLSVRPMKGTRTRTGDASADADAVASLEASLKDRAENVMIVDLMRNDLGRVCEVGTVEVPALFTIETYASVFQMTSTVTGLLAPEYDGLDAARACFPPGSMTGAPKIAAMKLLEDLESSDRGWYSGVIGWIGACGNGDLSVVIRTALVGETTIRWHVGGGIVADSTVEDEWAEALAKCPLGRGGVIES